MNADRLMRLVALLRRDAANPKGVQFDMSTWGETKAWGEKRAPASCGTAACAFGLAAISGEFAAEGLTYVKMGFWGGRIFVKYAMMEGFDAAAAFFGISGSDANYLFGDGTYNLTAGAAAEVEVANEIERYVANGGKIDGRV